MKRKVLFLVQLPPPVHGASMVNQFIKSSNVINTEFNTRFIDISPEISTSGLGKFSFKKLYKSLCIIAVALRTFVQFKPDVVYVAISPHGFAFYKDALMALLLKLFSARLVYHLHGKGIHDEARSKLKRIIYRLVFSNVDIIHLSEGLYSDIETVRGKGTRLYSLANGVPDDSSGTVKEKKETTFIYLSNFIPEKGAYELIRAVNCLDESYRGRFIIKLVGAFREQSYMLKIEAAINEMFPESFELIGPAYGDEKSKVLSESDVFVLPTRYKNECFPLSILEGMCHSLAVVSTYEGAIPDIIDDDVNGRLFDINKIDSLTKIISQYIDDSELLVSHQKSARAKFLHEYEVSVFERNLCKIINEILAGDK